MKARILPLESDAHRRAELLLPWFSSGTLEPAERALVESHLSTCARCRTVVAFQERLRAVPDPEAPAARVDRDWAVLRARLDAGAAPPTPAPRGARLGWPMALGFQAALLGLLLVWTVTTRQPEPYRALGSTASAPAANALVVFRPRATEAELRSALRGSDARLVGGPTVTDAWLVHLPETTAPALARLRAHAAVLQVESLVSEGAR